eukprot:8613635-Pyramimonas_sp.AAC.2
MLSVVTTSVVTVSHHGQLYGYALRAFRAGGVSTGTVGSQKGFSMPPRGHKDSNSANLYAHSTAPHSWALLTPSCPSPGDH